MTQKNKTKATGGAVRTVIVGCIGLVLLYMFLSFTGNSFAMKHQHDNSMMKLSMAEQRMEENAADAEKDWAVYDKFINEKVTTVSYLMDQKKDGRNDLAAIAEQWGLSVVYLTDADGRVELAVGGKAGTLEEAGLSRLVKYAKGEDGHAYKTVDNICYYLHVRDDGKYLVGGVESAEMIAKQDERFTAAYSLRDMKIGKHGFIMAVSAEDGTIAYSPKTEDIGLSAEKAFGITDFESGLSGWVKYNNAEWYLESRTVEADGDPYILLALASKDDITESTNLVVYSVMLVCAIAVILMAVYAWFLHTDEKKYGNAGNKFICINDIWLLDLGRGKKMLTLLYIVLAVLVLGTAYQSSMTTIGRQMRQIEDRLASVQEVLIRNDARTEDIVNKYENEYSRRAENIAWSLQYDPSLVNDEKLVKLRNISDLREIDVFNVEGRLDATSGAYKDFELSTDEEDQSYAFWNVVKGYENLLIQEVRVNETTKTLTQYIGVARRDKRGMVQIAIEPSLLEERLEASKLSHILKNMAVENGGFLFAADKDTKTLSSYPDENSIGKDISVIGMKETALRDRYVGWQKLDGISYFVMSQEHADQIVYAAVPTGRVFADVIPAALLAGAAGLIILLFMMAAVMLASDEKDILPEKSTEAGNKRFFVLTADGGTGYRTEDAAARWDGKSTKFSELDAPEKMARLVKYVLGGAALLLLLASAAGITAKSPLITFVLSGLWEHSLNLFSFSYVAYIVILILAASSLMRMIIGKITGLGSSRMETIGRLLNSFIKYVSVIGAIFYGLQFFGVDSMTMLAGAGIFTLIIGLGAQSLIADILAGLFIVFEGEFRVGDIVTIDGWRGTVEEIGIRTTKIKSPGQDIKIFRNSGISGVINQTRQYSFAGIDVGIEYGESLERVEAILKQELPHIKQHLPAIVDGPFYKGVSELGESSVNIKIVAKCREKDRLQLLRDLNREIKLVFDRNDIGIPFPQIVLNEVVVREKANASQKRQANEFVKEQNEKTKDMSFNGVG